MLQIIKSKKTEIIETLFNSQNEDFQKIKKMFKIFESTPVESIPYNDYSKLYQQLIKTKEAKEKTFSELEYLDEEISLLGKVKDSTLDVDSKAENLDDNYGDREKTYELKVQEFKHRLSWANDFFKF